MLSSNDVQKLTCSLKHEFTIKLWETEWGTMFLGPKRRIEAEEFVLRGADGSIRAALMMTEDGPGLFLYDQSGIVRAGLVLGNDAPGVALFDSLGKPRVSLGLAINETATLLMRDVKGTPLAAMVMEEAGPRLIISEANHGARVEFAAQGGDASLMFADQHGKRRMVQGTFRGVPGITLMDAGGEPRAKLEADKETSTFELYNPDGKASSSQTIGGVSPRLQAADLEAKLTLEIAERQKLEKTLSASASRYNALTAATAQLVWTTNPTGEVIEGIPLWRSFTGQSEEEVKGAGWMQALHPEDRERVQAVSKQGFETRSSYEMESRVRRQNGEYSEFAVRAVPVLDDDESVREWVLIATDVSERKRLEEALRGSEERLSVLTAASSQLQESLQASELARTSERQRLEETLGVSEERIIALTAASNQLKESLQARDAAHTSERQRLGEALRATEERVSALTAANNQLQESFQASELSHASERQRLEEGLRANEERVSALTVASSQLQKSMQASEVAHTSERQRLREALGVSEERISALTAASSQLQELMRASEAAFAAERKRMEEALRASEDRVTDLSASQSRLEETLRISGEDYAAGRKQLEEALRVCEEQLNNQIVAKGQLEETLRAREERYTTLAAAAAHLVWTTDATGGITDGVPAWMTFTGQSADEAKGRGWLQALHPEDREPAGEVWKKALETRSPYKTEYRLRRHDGEYRVLAARGAPVADAEGTVYEWIGTATDITEEKQAEILRRTSEKKYRGIVEGAPEGIWIIDPDNRTTFANPRLAQMLGWSEEEMSGRSLFDFLDEEGRQSAVENLACGRRGVAVQFDLNLLNKEGHDLQTRASTVPLFDEAGQYCGALALIIDLTEQELMGAQQQQAEKLHALGQLAGGVAHGLNNFLTVINGYSELLLGTVPRSSPLHESVAQIKKAGEQAVGLVSPLLAFSQGQILWATVVDLNEVVTEVKKTLGGQLGEDIRLETVLSPSLGPIEVDAEQLQHVLMNLGANARDAMPNGGRLVIETQNVDLDESYAAKHLGLKPGPYVHLTVSDSGAGMTAETLAHLFEPFFTTKSQGQGSGLSLATAYGIVKQSGGSIRVESELGKGSTFHVYLPRMGESVTVPEQGKPAVTTLRGAETILVVEDQEEIRKLAQVVLKSYGYKVVVAANGWEALLYSERHAGPIHLMLTDVMMPGMTGQELADRLKPLRPEMEVVFMSGYVENGMVQPGTLHAGAGFLAKPFSPDALAKKVREVLGPPRSAGKVLVVDDEAGVRGFLRMVLDSVGYEVLEANDGEQALKQLDGEEVDLIIVDLETPDQQWLEKMRLLQKRQPDLRVIALSGTLGDEFLRAAEQLGAQVTLAKPIRADQLLEMVRRTAAE
jgi:PAS domain S-box-containing protein